MSKRRAAWRFVFGVSAFACFLLAPILNNGICSGGGGASSFLVPASALLAGLALFLRRRKLILRLPLALGGGLVVLIADLFLWASACTPF